MKIGDSELELCGGDSVGIYTEASSTLNFERNCHIPKLRAVSHLPLELILFSSSWCLALLAFFHSVTVVINFCTYKIAWGTMLFANKVMNTGVPTTRYQSLLKPETSSFAIQSKFRYCDECSDELELRECVLMR